MQHAAPLTTGQVDAFFEQGFVVLPDVFAPAEVEEMRAAFERLRDMAARVGESGMYRGAHFVLDRGDEDDAATLRILRIVWCGAAEPVLSRYGMDSRLLAMAARLLGSREMNQLINQAHFKQPGDGVEFPWHQDSTHRRFGQEEWRDVNGKGSYVQTVTAIDAVTEARLQRALLELLRGRTSFVVAHRLSTIRHADDVLVLDQGRIIEHGTHAVLLARGAHYAALYRQFVQVDEPR